MLCAGLPEEGAGGTRELREKVPAVLGFEPDREQILRFLGAAMRACRPGAPVTIDSSAQNAAKLAESLHSAVSGDPGVPQARASHLSA